MSPQNKKVWMDAEVQPILRRFAATRECLNTILLLIRENLESEAAFAVLQQAESTEPCPVCEGAGAENGLRCVKCKGIGRVAA